MGVQIPVVLPVLPGQSDRVRNFGQEVEAHKEEFERLNREGTVTWYGVWLQETPMGDFAIHSMEAEDPSRLARMFSETDYDQWWLNYLRDVHGVDLHGVPLDQQPTPPPQVFEWKAGA
jgi:hypothetical protein